MLGIQVSEIRAMVVQNIQYLAR